MRTRALLMLGVTVSLVVCSSSSAARAQPAVDSARVQHAVHLPPAAGVFDYQLGGSYRPAAGVQIVDRDRTSTPATGRYSICYVNAFQTQPGEATFWRSKHSALLLRVGTGYVHDPNWPGEYILDTSTEAKRSGLASIVGAWIDGCAAKGFDAIEADNLDSWTRHGVHGAITKSDDLAFARLLIRRAHDDGLAIVQKNVAGLNGAALGFDFAVAEECGVYHECGAYTKFYGRHVLEIEYTDNGRSAYAASCRADHGKRSIILRDRDVVARGARAYRYEHC